jgi:flagellar biogenesis protein FliO
VQTGLTRQAASVVFVFALLAALWLIRRRGLPPVLRRGSARPARSLHVVERLALTPRHTLHLLHVQIQSEGRELVVATHPEGCTLLMNAASLGEPIASGAPHYTHAGGASA